MTKSLIEIAKDIKAGKQSSEELVKYYFAQMDKYSHKMAVLEKFEDALDRAKEIDATIFIHQVVKLLFFCYRR